MDNLAMARRGLIDMEIEDARLWVLDADVVQWLLREHRSELVITSQIRPVALGTWGRLRVRFLNVEAYVWDERRRKRKLVAATSTGFLWHPKNPPAWVMWRDALRRIGRKVAGLCRDKGDE